MSALTKNTIAFALQFALLVPSVKLIGQVQSIASKTSFTKITMPVSPIKMQDLISGQYKNENIYTKMVLMSRVPGTQTALATPAKTATVDGVTYTLQKTPFANVTQPVQNIGAAVKQQSPDGLNVCTTQKTRVENVFDIMNQFNSQSRVNVGEIFSDDAVVNGTYARMNLSRKPIQITTDLVDYTQSSPVSNIEPVNDPDNLGQINQAIANLLRKNQNANIPGAIKSDVFEVHTAGQLAMSLNSNASVNLEALLGVPVSVGSDRSVTTDSRFDLSQVAAVIVQPFFQISVANASTDILNGTIPSNAVIVKNVLYGRVAIVTAVSALASSELQAALTNSIEVKDLVNADGQLSATAKALFEARAIKVFIYGGDVTLANGVAVGSITELKNYINGMKANVSAASAVPIAYSLAYIQDYAPVQLKAVTEFNDVECKHATQIRMSMSKILVTKVVDFGGDEELFGSIKASYDNNQQTLWTVPIANPIKKSENQFISSTGDEKFINIFPDQINSNSTINLQLNIKDKIEAGLEALGASDQAKADGFVSYLPSSVGVKVLDILNSNGGVLTKTYTLNEGSAEIKVTITFKAE